MAKNIDYTSLRELQGGTRPGVVAPNAEAAFALFLQRLTVLLGRDAFQAWGARLTLKSFDGSCVVVSAPTELHCERLIDRVGMVRLRGLWREVDPGERDICLVAEGDHIRPAPCAAASERVAPIAEDRTIRAAPPTAAEAVAKEVSPVEPGEAERTFDNFVTGSCNQVAHALARAIALGGEAPARLGLIHGGYGAGKSHLLQAAADAAPDALYFSADRFRSSFVGSLSAKQGLAFKEKLRSARLLLVDDVHLLGGSEKTQAELANTIVDLLEDGGRVLLAADRSADKLDELDGRLRERLRGGVSCPIAMPELDMRRRIVESMAQKSASARSGVAAPADVLDFIASAVKGAPRALEAALATVETCTVLMGKPMTFEAAREALDPMLAETRRKVTVEDIQKHVAVYHGMKVSDLLSRRRTRDVVRPRQQAMFLCKEFTTRSLPDIGRRFANRDHTTVMHACRRIQQLCEDDATVRADIDALRRDLRQRVGSASLH